MSDNMKIYINGRFLTQNLTGVQRYAWEMVKAIDEIIEHDYMLKKNEYIVITPKNILFVPKLKNINVVHRGYFKGHLWEQLELPFFTADGFLINFCGGAPIIKCNQTVTIHDAAVSAMPQSFSCLFRLWYTILFKIFGRTLEKVFTVSEFSRNELEKYYGIPKEKIIVTYNGIDHISSTDEDNRILDTNKIRDTDYILAVSSLNPSKNFGLIIDVAKVLQDKIFVIVGGGNSAVFRKINIDVPPNVIFVGHVTDEELIALYKHAKVFIYPSIYEGFGIPPLEAMVNGCPAIVSDLPVFHEVYGNWAYYCECSDVMAWKNTIEAIAKLEKKDYRKTIINKYKWEYFAKKLLNSLGFSVNSNMLNL